MFSTGRTIQKGWVKELYIDPIFHFKFFEFLPNLESQTIYLIFYLKLFFAIGIILGAFYRISTIGYFVLFTYVELIDKTYYLNHYYLVSLLCFLLIFLPSHRFFSVDCVLSPKIKSTQCLNWQIDIIKIQLSIVYFFAGLAKVNEDWLLYAEPMSTWLPGRNHIPIIGKWFHLKTTAFFFSWAGCLYDLFIWIFLWSRKTRGFAYFVVIIFHVLTVIIFPRIGMFPYIMVTSGIIFFNPIIHGKILSIISINKLEITYSIKNISKLSYSNLALFCFGLYICVQLALPMRYLAYPGHLFWHEKGFNFSWRVMLMEKNGLTNIIIRDPVKKIQWEVNQDDYLIPFQKQQMRSQPDMLLQFADYLGNEFETTHSYAPQVYIKSRLSLNGRRSQAFTNDSLDVYGNKPVDYQQFIIPLKARENK